MEMFEVGFFCVGEFYYFYYDRDGVFYVDIVEMVVWIVVVSVEMGIGFMFLLVFYVYLGFGGVELIDG